MLGQPCQNPSCNSYGKPHPNCRCYSNLAEGGEPSFCSKQNTHSPGCEYRSELHDGDPSHHVSGYLAKHGVVGLMNLHKVDDPKLFNSHVKQGHKDIDHHVEAIFLGQKLDKYDHSKIKDMIDKWMEKGGIHSDVQDAIYDSHKPQSFAKGGEVSKPKDPIHNDMIATAYPDHNVMMQNVKGRVSNYLNSQRPQENTPKLAFDPEPDQRMQKKTYDSAREIAGHPLEVLKKINNGTVEPIHVKHLNAMYPELSDTMQKKMTERITKDQLDGKRPSYTARQGMSLLLGTPLSSELKPQNIQAAQATFQMQNSSPQSPQGGGEKPKKKTSALTKSSQSFLTGNQSLASRQQKQ